VDLNEIARQTERFTGAELAAVCQEAGLTAMRRTVSAAKAEPSAPDGTEPGIRNAVTVKMEDLLSAVRSAKPLFGGPMGRDRLEAEVLRLCAFEAGGSAASGVASMLGTAAPRASKRSGEE